jgi:hypothetical protein
VKDFSVTALFCEDIRPETSGQETLVGLLGDGIEVNSLPAMIPKLSFYIRANFAMGFELNALSFDLVSPSGHVIFTNHVEKSLIEESYSEAKAKEMLTVGIKTYSTFSPFPITEAGFYKLNSSVNEETRMTSYLKVTLQ